jgi:hypothetical protein
MMQCSSNWQMLLVACLLGGSASAAEPDPWTDLDLATMKIRGVTVHFERAMGDQMDRCRAALIAAVDDEGDRQKQIRWLADHADEVVDDLNQIIGHDPTQDERADQIRMLLDLIDNRLPVLGQEQWPLTLYVVTHATLKAHLRSGKLLPGFSYDPADNTAIYKMTLRASPDDHSPVNLAIPIADVADIPHDMPRVISLARRLTTHNPVLVLHELAEGTLLMQMMRTRNVHSRWFTDGFANVLAVELTRRHIGEAEARRAADEQSIAPYLHLKNEVNLGFWLSVAVEIRTPLDDEEQLRKARYCFATHEAQRLVRHHGLEVLRKILEQGTDDWVKAASAASGENIAARLAAYQSFDTASKGIETYADRFTEAIVENDDLAALRAALRINELQGGRNVQQYAAASHLLHRMGHVAAGRNVIERQLRFLERKGQDKAVVELKHAFVIAALRLNQPVPAYDIAEQILTDSPDDVPALVIRMHRLAGAGQLQEAKRVAEKITVLVSDPDHPARVISERILREIDALESRTHNRADIREEN